MSARSIVESEFRAPRPVFPAPGTIPTKAPVPLADGVYEALRYGYSVEIDGQEFATTQGMRCTRDHAMEISVRVAGGQLYTA